MILEPVNFNLLAKYMSVEVKMRKGETVDKALRRLKKKLDREQIIVQAREKRYFVSPSRRKYKKKQEQAFTDMLRRRYADM